MFRGSRDCFERTVSSGNLGNYECLAFNSRASCSTFGRQLTSSGIETHIRQTYENQLRFIPKHHGKIETNEKYVNKKTTPPASSQKILSWHDPANFEATVNLISVLGTLSTSFMLRRCEPFNLSRGPSPATLWYVAMTRPRAVWTPMMRWVAPSPRISSGQSLHMICRNVANLSRCGSPGELCSLWRSHKGLKAKMAGLQQWPCGRVWLPTVFCFLNSRGMPPGTYMRVLLLPHRYLVSEKQISSGLQIRLQEVPPGKLT